MMQLNQGTYSHQIQISSSVENTISVDILYSIKISNTYKLFFGWKAKSNLEEVDFTILYSCNLVD